MTRPEQKKRERQLVEFYLKQARIDGAIIEQERPDFVVTGAQKIGIEVTEYHQPVYDGRRFSRSNIEAEWEKIRAVVRDYREKNPELENLSVYLDFRDLQVPPTRDHRRFVEEIAVVIRAARPQLTTKTLDIRITKSHPEILNQYLRLVALRVVKSRGMDWDSTLSYAPVGTSDEELCAILAPKLGHKKPPNVDELHLVLEGAGGSGGTYIGMLEPEGLANWSGLNAAIVQSDYAMVTILNYQYAGMWKRGQGWSKLVYPV